MAHTHTDNSPVVVHDDNDKSIGSIVGIILLVVVGLFLLFYGLPYLANSIRSTATPNVSVPEQIDVNVNK